MLVASVQWGNIVNGIELARRVRQTEVFAPTTPILTTSDGLKMGKSNRALSSPALMRLTQSEAKQEKLAFVMLCLKVLPRLSMTSTYSS
jgi:tyrosyl-tRNA synthetase